MSFAENTEDRPVKRVRNIRFERWQNPTEKNPNPEPIPVPMQFEAMADVSGMAGVVGQATIRGALYAIGMTKHDLMALLEDAERVEDQRRAEHALNG